MDFKQGHAARQENETRAWDDCCTLQHCTGPLHSTHACAQHKRMHIHAPYRFALSTSYSSAELVNIHSHGRGREVRE
jgi:hypothetical protein